MRNLIIALFCVGFGTSVFAQNSPAEAKVSENIFPNANIKSAAPFMADLADGEVIFSEQMEEEEETSAQETKTTGYKKAYQYQPVFVPARSYAIAFVNHAIMNEEIA